MDDLYDEFGNYIGGDVDDDSLEPENNIDYDDHDTERLVDENALVVHDDISGTEGRQMQIEEDYDGTIVLHEDKRSNHKENTRNCNRRRHKCWQHSISRVATHSDRQRQIQEIIHRNTRKIRHQSA